MYLSLPVSHIVHLVFTFLLTGQTIQIYVPTHTLYMVMNIEKGNYFVCSEKYDDVEQFS